MHYIYICKRVIIKFKPTDIFLWNSCDAVSYKAFCYAEAYMIGIQVWNVVEFNNLCV